MREPVTHPDRMQVLCVTPFPPSPPRSGGQARMHGLVANLAKHHDLTLVSLVDDGVDVESCARAISEYTQDFTLVPHLGGSSRWSKRMLQARSLVSPRSYQRLRFSVAGLQELLDRLLWGRRFDVVKMAFPYLSHLRVRQAPPGKMPPPVVIDTHDIAYDLMRQVSRSKGSLGRRVYAALNWRKLWREERRAYLDADGICVCSEADGARVLSDAPAAKVAVIPNAADVDFFQPRTGDPEPDGRTVLFFGLLSTFPNQDGVLFFLREIWPLIQARRPDARCKIVGAHPPAAVKALAGPSVEVTGLVDDLRPHLASAAAVVVPLRLGSGTRLKIVEAMAMGKAVVSTRLGAEGIDAVPGRHLLIADEADAFASAVVELLNDPQRAARLGESSRALAVERYSWSAATLDLERFFAELVHKGAAEPRELVQS